MAAQHDVTVELAVGFLVGTDGGDMQPQGDQPVAVRMFGPLRCAVAGRTLGPRDFGGIKPKQLLEILLLERGRPVPKDRIADHLWGEHLPRHAAATIETYVSLLRSRLAPRRELGHRRIVTEHGGYRIPPEGLSVDVDRFEALVRRAAGAEPAERRSLLESAVTIADHDPWVGDSDSVLRAVQGFLGDLDT